LKSSFSRLAYQLKNSRTQEFKNSRIQESGSASGPYGALFEDADLEKEMFGSVTSCFEVAFPPLSPLPPLWHEAREIITAPRINLAARSICFRICNNSRTNLRCKLLFEEDPGPWGQPPFVPA
jgi:hypothetical protein